jgi:succinoglycan biosynthesis transport protein ExoP
MSISQLIATLRARKFLFLLCLLGCVIPALLLTFVLPERFTAAAAVIIDVKSPDPIAGVVLPGMAAPSYMATQMEVFRSERVARKVITALKLGESPQLVEQWRNETKGEGDFAAWLADLLQRNLDVTASRDANVFNIMFTASDPRFASATANSFLQAYIDVTSELRTEPAKQFSNMFDAQAKQLRDRLAQAQMALSEFQREKGMIANDERLDIETNRLNELSTQLVTMQALSSESANRKANAGANIQEALANPVVSGLKMDIARQDAQLKELSAKYGPAHPAVVQAQASVQELRGKIDAEIARVTSSVSINNNVNQAREGQIKAALEAQRQKVLSLKSQRDQAAVLMQDVANAQRAYDVTQARYAQTSMESQTLQTNVSPLKYATPPPKPSSPKAVLNVAAGIFLGTLVGLGACIGREAQDRRVRHPQDVELVVKLPIMANFPKMDFLVDQSKIPARLMLPSQRSDKKIPRLPAN